MCILVCGLSERAKSGVNKNSSVLPWHKITHNLLNKKEYLIKMSPLNEK